MAPPQVEPEAVAITAIQDTPKAEKEPEAQVPTDLMPTAIIPDELAPLVETIGNPQGDSRIIDFHLFERDHEGLLEFHYVEDRGPNVPGRYRYLRQEVLTQNVDGTEVEVGRLIQVSDRIIVDSALNENTLNAFLAPYGAKVSYAFTQIPGHYSVKLDNPTLAAQDALFTALENDANTIKVEYSELQKTDP